MTPQTMDRHAIARRIPHAGPMCLLTELLQWDDDRLVCRASTHRAPDHPMAVDGRVGAVCAVEYASQAMALHGALTGASAGAAAGLLTTIRDLRLHRDRLDDLVGDLHITVHRIADAGGAVSYGFEVGTPAGPVASGRALVMLDAAATGAGR
ncbi:MAG: 3-hydroxylacyl-ACP dehydratase [Burkholderiales bacterium]|nr:3-hydroxylacyl-ACP dehydratase [Burkholderiales bacterium]